MTKNEKKQILKCFPMYNVGGVKVDDIIQIPHVLAKYNVGVEQARMWLNELASEGYLYYGDGADGRICGWHLTELGYSLLYE